MRLALTTACRNAFLQAVVNDHHLYKTISVILFLHFFFIFSVIYYLYISVILDSDSASLLVLSIQNYNL